MKKRNLLYCNWIIVLFFVFVCSFNNMPVSAQEITPVSDKNALTTAVSNKKEYIQLQDDIDLDGSTLSISSGKIVLDLNGYELSTSKSQNSDLSCIVVSGDADLIIKGNGRVSANNTHKSLVISRKSNAIALSYNGGKIQIYDGVFEAESAKKDKYTLDPSEQFSVDDMISYGCYMKESSDYGSTGLTVSPLTIAKTEYTAHYSFGILPGSVPSDALYDIENPYIEPSITDIINGYDFNGWQPQEGAVKINNVYVLKERGEKGTVTFTAQWEAHPYAVCYKVDGKDLSFDSKFMTYTVEQGIKELPIPQKEGWKFKGWYKNDEVEMSVIPAGIGDLTLYAHWLKNYKINLDVQGGDALDKSQLEYTEEDELKLPIPTKGSAYFDGWFDKNGKRYEKINKGSSGDLDLIARWSERYSITFDVNGGDASSKPSNLEFSQNTDGKKLPTNVTRLGYTFTSWYKDAACLDLFGTSIPINTKGNMTLYAGWRLTEYTILFYNAPFDKEPIDRLSYTIKDEKALPIPTKTSFTFNGWYNQKTNEPVASIQEGMSGDMKLYAKWSPGYIVNISQKEGGIISVKQKENNKEVTSGTTLPKGTELIVSVTPASSYALDQLVIGEKSYTTSSQTVTMPEDGLFITASFKDNRPSASAPEIITTPKSTEKVPVGMDVKVSLQKTDSSTELYYSVDGAPDKKYAGTFVVSSAADTVIVKAIARKSGMKDGVTTRVIAFDTNKINLTFDLPSGVKATNPEGGEVVSAVASGGTFEFKLVVDKNYFVSLDSMTVAANDSVIRPNYSGLYILSNQTGNVKITISRLTPKTYTVTLKQNANGEIFFSEDETSDPKTVNYGDKVSVKAEAGVYYKFSRWSDGSQYNPHELTITKDTTVSATFIPDYKVYSITLPELEGITVKPFSGYTTEVMRDSTFKFYVQTKNGYRIEGDTIVCANGEVLPKLKGGYMLTYVKKNYSISVKADVVRTLKQLNLASGISAINLATATDATETGVYPETMVQVYAMAPDGKLFAKWNDGKTDNPRVVTAEEAGQLHPLFQTKPADKSYVKMEWVAAPGAGLAVVNGNVDAVEVGNSVTLKVVLLPSYSQSAVKLLANGKEVNETVSMHSSSATRTLLYSLENVTAETKLTLSGLSVNTYALTLKQTDGGTVSASRINNITDGTTVTLTATAKSGDIFVKWWDGNTLNPYPYTVTSDTEVKAYFLGAESTVDNESIPKEEKVQITITGQTLSIMVAEESMLYIWDYKGSLFRNQKIPVGGYSMDLPAGVYLVKVGDMGTRKIIIR